MDINLQKIENAILFFIEKNGGSIDKMKLMKLLWLSDRLHLNKYGRLILKDRYYALPHGPVPSTALDICKRSKDDYIIIQGYNIKSEREYNKDFFSKSDLKIMGYVWEKFKNISPLYFSEYSHKYPEWSRFEKYLNDTNSPNRYDIIIHDFFEFPDLNEFSDLLTEEDITLSKEEFNINNSIQNFLK